MQRGYFGFALDGVFATTNLQCDPPDSFNDIANPDCVIPEALQLHCANGMATLPPHSLTVVQA